MQKINFILNVKLIFNAAVANIFTNPGATRYNTIQEA
jgi:hypothetical protein